MRSLFGKVGLVSNEHDRQIRVRRVCPGLIQPPWQSLERCSVGDVEHQEATVRSTVVRSAANMKRQTVKQRATEKPFRAHAQHKVDVPHNQRARVELCDGQTIQTRYRSHQPRTWSKTPTHKGVVSKSQEYASRDVTDSPPTAGLPWPPYRGMPNNVCSRSSNISKQDINPKNCAPRDAQE